MGEERVWLRASAGSASHLTGRWERLMEPARGDPLGASRQALQTGLRTRLEEMRSRLERFEQRSLKKRQLAPDAMCEVGLKKLEQPDFTASARAGIPSLLLISETEVPTEYWVPQPPKLDRQALLADLKRGEEITGAQLGNPKPTLGVRTK